MSKNNWGYETGMSNYVHKDNCKIEVSPRSSKSGSICLNEGFNGVSCLAHKDVFWLS